MFDIVCISVQILVRVLPRRESVAKAVAEKRTRMTSVVPRPRRYCSKDRVEPSECRSADLQTLGGHDQHVASRLRLGNVSVQLLGVVHE